MVYTGKYFNNNLLADVHRNRRAYKVAIYNVLNLA